MIKPLLIEIGVEELPAIPFLKELPNIEKKWLSILESHALISDFEFYYTPRRLVLWHSAFLIAQPNREDELYGAPYDVAFKDGIATPAAIGFAKKCGIEISEIGKAEKNGKDVLYFKKVIEGVSSKNLIGEMVEEFIATLSFGKSMRWGSYDKNFIRPIRWIGAMLGEENISFKTYEVQSGAHSYPHRTISYDAFSYDFSGDYFKKLEEGGVILYQEKRKEIILEQFKEIEKKENIIIEMDEDLLAEIVAITENPKALMGRFDEDFLRLPSEVIITSMKEHQRYFPVFKDGKITNKFIVVSNAISDDYGLIVKGNEKVLRARLSDGIFFYDNDLKNGLNFAGLKDVVYLDGLGSVFEKVVREKSIAEYLEKKYKRNLGIQIDYKNDKEISSTLNRAIMISKADLLSEMVYEFTELQGLMGYYYAKAAGEDDLVSIALKEQYLPDSEDSELPSNLFSSLVSLSNKIDSLIALFSIGKIPTGTKDPFALRRAVNGIIKIVLKQKIAFNIKDDLKNLSKTYASFDFSFLENFFLERIYKIFDANPSIIKAVLESGERDIVELSLKIEALKSIVNSSGFKEVFSTFKRVANIIKDIDVDDDVVVNEALFEAEEEKLLYKEFTKKASKNYTNYEEKLDSLFGLKPQIDNFFDNVMVNVEDKNIAANRQNLIASIYKEFKSIADIKEISI